MRHEALHTSVGWLGASIPRRDIECLYIKHTDREADASGELTDMGRETHLLNFRGMNASLHGPSVSLLTCTTSRRILYVSPRYVFGAGLPGDQTQGCPSNGLAGYAKHAALSWTYAALSARGQV